MTYFVKSHKRADCGLRVWYIEAFTGWEPTTEILLGVWPALEDLVSKVKLITCSWVYIAVKIIIGTHGGEERE